MDLKLYKFDSCPYCQKVFHEIEAQGRTDIEYRDIRENKEYYQELLRVGGIDQVPCLFIDGKPLYESDDIVQWLREHR
ncbi:MAG: glutathione S-transferase N-terminal domain-containing protein [Clostridiales bacterium]|nr:glutathione S-transferase N-terminal domain-containing protein [Clostridiales bacterium]